MKKIILSIALFACFFQAQSQIVNAVPVCHGNGDPNGIAILDIVDQSFECAVYVDTFSNVAYLYTPPTWTAFATGGGDGVITGVSFSGSPGDATRSFTVTRSVGADITGSINVQDGDAANNNEGSLTVLAGTASTSVISSNTSGSIGVTVTAGTGMSIAETGNNITLTNANPDQTVVLNEAGGIDVTGTYPNFTVTDNKALPVYTSNAAALTGGLVVGQKYRCGTGSTSCTAGSIQEVY